MSEFDDATHVGDDGVGAIRDGWDINGGGRLVAQSRQLGLTPL